MRSVKNDLFKVGDTVVYPSHGVGHITGEEVEVFAGVQTTVYVITFSGNSMTLRIPKARAKKIGLRHVSSDNSMNEVIEILSSNSKSTKIMWNKRIQSYEAKLNSGNISSLAEVVSELHKEDIAELSYSEKNIYNSALDRLADEFSLAKNIQKQEASLQILEILKQRKVI